MAPEERAAWIALSRVPGIGVRRFYALVRAFGGAGPAYEAGRARFLTVPGCGDGLWHSLRRFRSACVLGRAEARARELGVRILLPGEAHYPPLLAAIHDPPPVLYLRGDVGRLRAPGIAVVGTRSCTAYGAGRARELGREAARAGLTVISGLARGIDAAAHAGALEGGGGPVGVLGAGPDVVYPSGSARLHRACIEEGCLVSEFAPGTPPSRGNFPARNRIISGLAAGVVVVEAGGRSGALITADFALEQGREVFAVPGPVTSPRSRGCHRLIQQGAGLVTGLREVLADLPAWCRLPPAGAAAPRTAGDGGGGGVPAHRLAAAGPAGEAARRVWAVLSEAPVAVEEIVAATGLPPAGVTAALGLLEATGHVAAGDGMYVRLSGSG